MEEICDGVLDVSIAVMEQVSEEFDDAEEERQYELLALGEKVLQLVTMVEPHLTARGHDDVVTPIVETVEGMVQSLEYAVRRSRVRGRPSLRIPEAQLRFLLSHSFTVTQISQMFGCHRRTVHRRIREYEVSSHHFSTISDDVLDDIVKSMCTLHRRSGEKSIAGKLRSMGLRIQRERIRESIQRVDPTGIEGRVRRALHRRVYSVASPNALWHLDGYHKLIRWRIVVHGGIDGYSRLVTYLKASNNNCASTAFAAFQRGISEYGLPSRIRTDRGGENVEIARYMLQHPARGPGRGSVITGRSVHNQRIERLWRDLFCGCIEFFYRLFYDMEDEGLLNRDDVCDLYSLHIVFLPVIQLQLDVFREGWAQHQLRTCGNRTPQQLWIQGLLTAETNSSAVTGLTEVS